MFNRLIYTALILLVPLSILAQPGNPSPGPVGGVFYLLLAGVGYGVYRLRKTVRK